MEEYLIMYKDIEKLRQKAYRAKTQEDIEHVLQGLRNLQDFYRTGVLTLIFNSIRIAT